MQKDCSRSYKAENHDDWTTREGVEEKFKHISDARDEMLLCRGRRN